MIITTDRLTIREISHNDAERISEMNNCSDVNELFSSLTEKNIDDIINDAGNITDLMSRLTCGIDTYDETVYGALIGDTIIGYIAIVNGKSETPELRIEIDPNYQGKGYGYEFLKSLLIYLFENKRYDFIIYRVVPTNKASLALINKIGAFLQKPTSKTESLLFMTYHISRISMDVH